ncbi:MAG: hypothetical protein ABIQ89_04465 [Candidatus Saccharimonadales bacterium]
MSLKNNQRGFSPLIILLVIVILGVLGFAGWTVWKKSKATPATTSSAKTEVTKDKTAKPEPTYTMPTSAAFRVVAPDGWVNSTCADNPDTLFLATTSDKLGKCQSDFGGTVVISKVSGNATQPESYYSSDASLGSVVYSDVTIDGVSGHKVSYTVTGAAEVGPAVGTQQTTYILYDGTSSYIITYTRLSGEADLSAEVQALAESFHIL